MDPSKKLKTCGFADESSASSSSSSSSSGHKLRDEKMVVQVVKKEAVSSSRQIQKSEREKIRRDKLNEQFLVLGDALDPKRPKSDKASKITDTIQMLKDLMSQVDKLKAEYVTLSQESRELIQEKSELIEEKSSLKSDIEILNAQYQQRITTMVPWIPHYTYPLPVVAITQGGPVSLQPFPLSPAQNPAPIPIPCSTFIPYSASSQQPSSSSGASNKQDLMRNINHSDHKDDVGLELELKIHDSSSAHQYVSGKEKKGSSTTTRSSSSKASVQYSSSASVNDILKPLNQ